MLPTADSLSPGGTWVRGLAATSPWVFAVYSVMKRDRKRDRLLN